MHITLHTCIHAGSSDASPSNWTGLVDLEEGEEDTLHAADACEFDYQ